MQLVRLYVLAPLQGVNLIHFDMELKTPADISNVFPSAEGLINTDSEWGGDPTVGWMQR